MGCCCVKVSTLSARLARSPCSSLWSCRGFVGNTYSQRATKVVVPPSSFVRGALVAVRILSWCCFVACCFAISLVFTPISVPVKPQENGLRIITHWDRLAMVWVKSCTDLCVHWKCLRQPSNPGPVCVASLLQTEALLSGTRVCAQTESEIGISGFEFLHLRSYISNLASEWRVCDQTCPFQGPKVNSQDPKV